MTLQLSDILPVDTYVIVDNDLLKRGRIKWFNEEREKYTIENEDGEKFEAMRNQRS